MNRSGIRFWKSAQTVFNSKTISSPASLITYPKMSLNLFKQNGRIGPKNKRSLVRPKLFFNIKMSLASSGNKVTSIVKLRLATLKS